MKLKNLLIPALLALGLAACNEESQNYSGTWANDHSSKLILEKLDKNEYKITLHLITAKSSTNGYVKNERLYDSSGELLGEFKGNEYKTVKGYIYRKTN